MIADPLPSWLDKEAWESFIAMRKMKGKSYPFTPKAQERILQRLAAFHALGQNTSEILWKSHDRGWSDVFAQPVQVVPVLNPAAETAEFRRTKDWMAAQQEQLATAVRGDEVKRRVEAIKNRLKGTA